MVALPPVAADPVPLVDHHQHIFDASAIGLATGFRVMDGADLVALLDAAGIRRAAVLSVAYQFGNPNRAPVENEYEKVKAENDWTSSQVARFPDRLRGFCGVNPLKDYALDEIARCARDPQLRFGVKMHFGNSDVDLDNPQHIAALRRVFAAANERRMAIAIHMRSSVTRQRPYGTREAAAFLNDVLPAAPDVTVQIAHLTGSGTYDDPTTDQALSVFVDAIAKRDPRMARVIFDVSGIAGYGKWTENVNRIVSRLRQIGMERLFYGSDSANAGGLSPKDAWAAFRALPLTDAELRIIASNVAPYMR